MTSFCTKPTTGGTSSPDLSMSAFTPSSRCARAQMAMAILIDEHRELAAKVAGKDMEIAMLLGEREALRRAFIEMLAQIEARRAVREACEIDKREQTCEPASSAF